MADALGTLPSILESGQAVEPSPGLPAPEQVAEPGEFVRRFRVELICFPLVVAVYAAHLFLSGYDRFYYDAEFYWQAGKSFVRDGHFSLYNYTGTEFHGYSVPLLSHVLDVVGSAAGLGAVTTVKVFGALFAATLGVVVIPRLARALFPAASVGVGTVLALNGLIFLFWRDYFGFPLSDYPALMATCLGLLAFLRGGALGYLVAGLSFALASNMRPSYMPVLVAALVIAVALPLRPGDWGRRSIAGGLLLAGAFVALLPQVLINHDQQDRWSPSLSQGRVLAMTQLSNGMRAQKYETYVGSPDKYPKPQVYYFDPSTTHVLEKEHIPTNDVVLGQYAQITSYRQYLGIVVRNPVELAANYVRHVFNGLNVRYPTPYIRDLEDTSLALSLLLYTLMFVAAARLLLPDARRALGQVRWAGVVVLLSACVTAIPSASESRYYLPLQFLIYMLVCFAPSTRASLLSGSNARRAAIAVSYVAFLLVCVTLSSAALAQLEYPGPTLELP